MMIEGQTFYHSVLRKTIVAFGSLFSNIKVERMTKNNQDDNDLSTTDTVVQTIDVPIAYAPKEKWLVRIDSDPTLENNVYGVFPRMSFEITGMNYDPSRKVSRMNKIVCVATDSSREQMMSPVPYNIDISLYIISKTQEDCLQIVEQILPYFTPDFTVSITVVPEMNVQQDIPIVLNSVNIQDDYDGDFQQRRFVLYTLNFTLKVNMFGPVSNSGIINKVVVATVNPNTDGTISKYTADQTTPTISAVEGWLDS
jgi:hypothetical protein